MEMPPLFGDLSLAALPSCGKLPNVQPEPALHPAQPAPHRPETRHLLTQSQDLQMHLSYKCTNSIGFIRGQRFAKKLPKSLEDGSATTSSGNAAYRTVPAASYRPSVRHCFKDQQMKHKVTGHEAKPFSSQEIPGGFLT